MTNFKIYKEKHKLQLLLDGFKGSLYIRKDLPIQHTFLIRHFDGNISNNLIPEMVDITKKIESWMVNNIGNQISVAQFKEYGEDYTIREHFLYQTSLSYIENPQNNMKLPESLTTLRNKIKKCFEIVSTEDVIKKVITKSFLIPARKTIYDQGIDTYTIAELSINEEDLIAWSESIKMRRND